MFKIFALVLALGIVPGDIAPSLSVDNTAEQNTQALQKMFDDGDEPLKVSFGVGQYKFKGPIKWPCHRKITLDGDDVAQLWETSYGTLFEFEMKPGKHWFWGKQIVKGFPSISGTLFKNTAGKDIRLGGLHVERCIIWPENAYSIDLATGYSPAPRIRDCKFYGGGIRWLYDGASGEPHATSGLIFESLYINTTHDRRPGPDIHLRGHQLLTVRDCICEGNTAGWMQGVDGD
jgi:hypothetical protein